MKTGATLYHRLFVLTAFWRFMREAIRNRRVCIYYTATPNQEDGWIGGWHQMSAKR